MRSFLYDIASGRSKGFIPAIISVLLFPLSLIYGLITAFLAAFYSSRQVKLPCKVISVGNITLGGTGKTLAVEYIARFLREKNKKIAILSRGYKKGNSSMGDEPLMLKNRLGDIPVIVDTDRVKGSLKAMQEYGVDTVLLDDGFQQWRIKKDLEILLVDAGQAFGNRMLLPAGILREGLFAIRRADIVILTKTDLAGDYSGLKKTIFRINPQARIFESVHAPEGLYRLEAEGEQVSLEGLRTGKTALLSGIADPDSFKALAMKLGADIKAVFSFPDHHQYSVGELEEIAVKAMESGITRVITTEKDAVKLAYGPLIGEGIDILVLTIALKLSEANDGEKRFRDRLLSIYSL